MFLLRTFKFFAICSLIASTLMQAAVVPLIVNTNTDTTPAGFGVGSGNSGDLRYVLNTINASVNTYTVTFSGISPTITLQGMLPIINLTAANNVTIDGSNGGTPVVINGGLAFPGLIVRQGTVSISNLTVTNTVSKGGGAGLFNGVQGGSALGAGGGLFLIGGSTTISSMTFTNCVAVGTVTSTIAPTVSAGGGAGMFKGDTRGSGGGGMGGQGGTTATVNDPTTGGGGIGRGLGGINTVGQGGTPSIGAGVGFDGTGFGGGQAGSGLSVGGQNAGGGGAGSPSPFPVNTCSGGGGLGGQAGTSGGSGTGGAGGFGGGGGAGNLVAGYAGVGGNGGFGGGGGLQIALATGAAGGFGGGGSAGGFNPGFSGGNGGFGAGGGNNSGGTGSAGSSGVGAEAGGTSSAGLGGAIFVNTASSSNAAFKVPYYNNAANFAGANGGGATLTIAGPVSISGSVGNGGGNGAAVGPHIFATTGPNSLSFDTTSADIFYNATIFDDSPFSLPGPIYVPGFATGAALTVQGPGTVTLAMNNGYSGGTNLVGGTIQYQTNQSFGNPAIAVKFVGSGTLTLQAGASGLTIANPILTNNNANTFDTNGNNVTFSGAITGPGTLNKFGLGTLTLTSIGNNYSGGTVVNGGTLALSGFGTVLSTGAVTVNTGTFSISGIIPGSLTIGGFSGTGGSVDLGSKQLIFSTATSATYAGVISGTGGITKGGSGTFQLTNTNTYSGLTTVSAGTLLIDTSTLNPAGGISISGGATLNINHTSATTGTYSGNINGNGALIAGGGTATTQTSIRLTGSNNYIGGTTIQANTLLTGPTTAIQGNIGNSGIVNFEGPGTYMGVISGAGITVINDPDFPGSGTVTFTSAQLYTSSTDIAAGTLALTLSGSIAPAATLNIQSGATLDISGIGVGSTTVGDLSATGTGAFISSGTILLGGKTLITGLSNTPTVTYAGVFIGNASSGLTKQGSGKLILTQQSPLFLGTTTISGGTLQINTNTLPSSNIIDNANLDIEQAAATTGTYPGNISGVGNVLINTVSGNTGTVRFTGNNSYGGLTTVTQGSLHIVQALNNTFNGNFSIAANATLDFDQTNPLTTGIYTGTISGAGNIAANIESGAGKVVLSGTRTYSGTTTVYAGILELINAASSTTLNLITVNSGAVLDLEQTSGIGTYPAGVTGDGSVIVNSINTSLGTVILSGNSNYTGTTTVLRGTLEILNNTSSTFVSAITVNAPGVLDLEQTQNTIETYSGGISGNGDLNINASGSPSGTIYLTGPIAGFTGPTTVFAGTLAGSTSTLPANLPIQVKTGGTVDIEQASGSGTFAGAIVDFPGQHGALAINFLGGSGTVVLSGADSYTGGTTVYKGALQGNVTNLKGSIAVNSNASVDIEQPVGTGIFLGTISDNGAGQHGSVTINKVAGIGAGTVEYGTPQTYTGGTTIFGGTLRSQPTFMTGNVAINSGAIFDLEQPAATVGSFSGNISGNGGVVVNSIVADTGTVILTGSNNYTGGTLVSNGTLQGNTHSLFGTITDNANVNFVQSFTGTFNGSFLGNGNINISGGGLVKFVSSDALFSGTTNLNGGRLQLNTTLGGNLFINALGILSGTGSVLGNVTVNNQGTINPGIGTFNIGGTYVQNSGSTYDVLINGLGQNSLLNIAGQATLAPGSALVVTPINGVPAINHVYTLLTAAGGLVGTYSTTTVNFPSIKPTVIYDSNNVYLELFVDFTGIALTYNQQQVANQLATLKATDSAIISAIFQQLLSIPLADARNALSQMSAQQYTNAIIIAELANRQFIRRLFDPLRTIVTTNPCKTTNTCCNYSGPTFDVWSSITGGRTFIHGNENSEGFRIADCEVCLGAQTTLQKRWTVGVALSYEKDTLGYTVGGSGEGNTVLGGLYGLYRAKRFYALVDATTGYSQQKVKRRIDVGILHFKPRGNLKVYQTCAYGEIGTDFAFQDTLVQPFLGIEFGRYHYNRFQESGGNPLEVTIFQKSKWNSFTRLGLHITTPPLRCGFTMNIDLAWQYRLTSLGNNIGVQFQEFGTKFNIQGLPFNRNSYEGSIRFNQTLYKTWEAFFEASCQGWNNSTAYSFIGGIKTTW